MIVLAILAFYLAGCAAIWVLTSQQRTRLVLKPFGLALASDMRLALSRYMALAQDLRAVQEELKDAELLADALDKELEKISREQFSFFDRIPYTSAHIDSYVDVPRYNIHTRVLAYDVKIDYQQVVLLQDLPNFLRVTKRGILRELYDALSAELDNVIGVDAFKQFVKAQKTPKAPAARRKRGA